jgi:hypothetical protein
MLLLTYDLMPGMADLVHIQILPGVSAVINKCLGHANIVLWGEKKINKIVTFHHKLMHAPFL